MYYASEEENKLTRLDAVHLTSFSWIKHSSKHIRNPYECSHIWCLFFVIGFFVQAWKKIKRQTEQECEQRAVKIAAERKFCVVDRYVNWRWGAWTACNDFLIIRLKYEYGDGISRTVSNPTMKKRRALRFYSAWMSPLESSRRSESAHEFHTLESYHGRLFGWKMFDACSHWCGWKGSIEFRIIMRSRKLSSHSAPNG